MTLKNTLQLLTIGIVTLAIGYGLGYFYAPEKVREVEKIVEKEKIVKEEYKKRTKKFDKDGKVVEETEETGTKESKTNTEKKTTEVEKVKEKKMWSAKGGIALSVKDPNKIIPRVGFETRLPIFNSSLGLEQDINLNNPLTGIYLRVEF